MSSEKVTIKVEPVEEEDSGKLEDLIPLIQAEVMKSNLGFYEANDDVIVSNVDVTIKIEVVDAVEENQAVSEDLVPFVNVDVTKSEPRLDETKDDDATVETPNEDNELGDHNSLSINKSEIKFENHSQLESQNSDNVDSPPPTKVVERIKRHVCDICEFAFEQKCSLNTHKRSRHSNLRPYKCKRCPLAFKLKTSLTRHIKNVHTKKPPVKEKPFACELCPYRTNIKYNLKSHMFKHNDKDERVKCPECDKTYKTVANMKCHMKVHEGMKFKCDKCEFQCTQIKYLRRHNERPCGPRSYKCKLCDYKTINHPEYADHVKNYRHDSFPCHICAFTAYTKEKLSNHLNTRHYGKGPLKCDVCLATFMRMTHLKLHARRHRCNLCPKDTIITTDRKLHRAEVHGIVEKRGDVLKCYRCGYTTIEKQEYLSHKRTHSKDDKFQCVLCPKAFAVKPSLMNHIAITHEKGGPFKGPDCDKTFAVEKNLNDHKITHSEKPQFKCEFCGMPFKCKISLTSHTKKCNVDSEDINEWELSLSNDRDSPPILRRSAREKRKILKLDSSSSCSE